MAVDAIKNLDLRRTPQPVAGGGVYGVSKTSGSRSGAMSKWLVKKLNRFSERSERESVAERSMDVVANDPHAASVVDGMAVNIAGTGLTAQSIPNAKALGWTRDQARDVQDQIETAWNLWCQHADARNQLQFWQIQYLCTYNVMVKGEFFRQPVMIDRPFSPFSLALQSIDSSRVFTPSDKRNDATIRDGIGLGGLGEPKTYFAANTNDVYSRASLPSKDFAKIPAWVAHRPGMLHGFVKKEDEQVRGIPVLSPAIKLIRDLGDYLDFELIGAIVASSFPVFIETSDPNALADAYGDSLDGTSSSSSGQIEAKYQEAKPGTIMYGAYNQKPHVLKSDRPGNSFDQFVGRVLRAIGAAVGMPYEVTAKDFSKTNYSSARAALLEAWRVYCFYQKWLVQSLCQPCFDMVLEEAWLRGMITFPSGSPDFYDARHLYTRAQWIPPRRGSVDPLKEIKSYVAAKDNNILTLAQIAAEMGGDWETTLEQRGREVEMERAKGISPEKATPDTTHEEPDDDENKKTAA